MALTKKEEAKLRASLKTTISLTEKALKPTATKPAPKKPAPKTTTKAVAAVKPKTAKKK